MSAEISERSFEEAIECGLLQYGVDACAGQVTGMSEAATPYGDTPPGGYRKGTPRITTGCSACCRATWWISCSPRSRRNG